MKILLLADLHANRDWYNWLVGQAPQYDLVCVAGDLLDIFAVDEGGQIQYLRNTSLPAMIATRVPVAISSGNHDGSAVMWLPYLNQIEGVVGDGSTQLVVSPSGEQIVVSTFPYYRSFQQHVLKPEPYGNKARSFARATPAMAGASSRGTRSSIRSENDHDALASLSRRAVSTRLRFIRAFSRRNREELRSSHRRDVVLQLRSATRGT